MQTCFLVNPRSGGGSGAGFIPLLQRLGDVVCPRASVHVLERETDLEGLIGRPDFSRIIIVGGDGTFSSILPFAVRSEKTFGILPVGTGNDLAKELGVYRVLRKGNLIESVRLLLGAGEEVLDVWACEREGAAGTLFCNYLSLGFDAAVIEQFEKLRNKLPLLPGAAGVLLNRSLYLIAALMSCGRKLPSGLSVQNEETGSLLDSGGINILFPNIRSYMGLGISVHDASPFDRRIGAVPAPSLFWYASPVLRKITGIRGRPAQNSGSWRVDLGTEGVPLQCDGEFVVGRALGALRISYAGSIRVLASVARQAFN